MDKMITLAKDGSLHARRQVGAFLVTTSTAREWHHCIPVHKVCLCIPGSQMGLSLGMRAGSEVHFPEILTACDG